MIGRGVSSECFSFSLGFFFGFVDWWSRWWLFSFLFSSIFCLHFFCSVLFSFRFPLFFFLARFPFLVLSPFGLTLRDSGVAHPPFSRLSTVNRCDIISGIHFKHHLTDKRSNVRRWVPATKIWGHYGLGPRTEKPFEGPFGLDGNGIGNLKFCRCFIRRVLVLTLHRALP